MASFFATATCTVLFFWQISHCLGTAYRVETLVLGNDGNPSADGFQFFFLTEAEDLVRIRVQLI